LIGGGSVPKPGEVSLAHNGVLFLDEFPEFKKNVLEVLRQPLEDNEVTISRASISISYPASVMLVAAMNPCPCGFNTDPNNTCSCSIMQVQLYRARISGPLLDRIDIHINVPPVRYRELSYRKQGESSSEIRQRVQNAREIQRERFKNENGVFCNAQMPIRLINKYCQVDQQGANMLEMAIDKFGMSARAYDRILKVSRTIADLDESDRISSRHISEAIQYRTLDRKLA
jgi:magnesium chelatase family protein